VEGSIHYPRRVIQTDSDVFRINKFTCDILDYCQVQFTPGWKFTE